MYTIILGKDGKYHCEGRIQDGTERWVCDSLEDAVKKMKCHAKIMNGTKIKKKHIVFLRERTVPVDYEEWHP